MAVYKNKKDDYYYIDYYVDGRRKRGKISKNKKLAENVLAKRKVEIAEGRYLNVRKKKTRWKFIDFANEYYKYHCANMKSRKKTHEVHLRVLRAYFKDKYLDQISVMDVEKFKTKRINEVSPATVNRALSCLKSLFNKAIAWEKFAGANPVCKVKMLKENNKRLRYLEKEEIERLLSVCDESLKPIVVAALNAGMRLGEILNLKWQDVDFKRGIIYLLKTKSGDKREIPMNELVRGALTGMRKHPTSEYLFCHKDGSPRKTVRKSFSTALKRLNIRNFRFHDLRHTFASHLVMAGIDLNTVRELLGHADLTMTLRYAHLSPNHKKKAVDVLVPLGPII